MSTEISYEKKSLLTFVDVLRKQAQQKPEQMAYTFLQYGKENKSVTYAELDQQAKTIAAVLQSSGYTDTPLLLLYPSGLDYIAAFFACLYAGAIAVPVYPPHSARLIPRIQAIITDSQARVVLTTEKILADIFRRFAHIPELQNLTWITTDTLFASSYQPTWQKPDLTNDSLAFLQYTSGSTSTPKGVMVSHSNLLHNMDLMHTLTGLDEQNVNVSWLPMFHDMGLIFGILYPLYIGYPTVLMDPAAFLQQPLRWLQAISDYRGTASCAPNFAYDLCVRRVSAADAAQLDLSSWKLAGNGSEPVRLSTLETFKTTFAPYGLRSDLLLPVYGLAEATLTVTAAPIGTSYKVKHVHKDALAQHRIIDVEPQHSAAQAVIGCGHSSPTQKVIAVHPETLMRCGPDEVGEIWIQGESVAQGYFHNGEETERTFFAYTANPVEGPFLRTGDLGFIQDGEIFITGRLKDLIIIKGRNHYPQDIEYTVEQSSPLIRAGCCIAFSIDVKQEEQLVVVAETNYRQRAETSPTTLPPEIEDALKDIRRNIAEKHEISVYQIKLVSVGQVPKTSSGKLQRRACRTKFLSGSLKAWNE